MGVIKKKFLRPFVCLLATVMLITAVTVTAMAAGPEKTAAADAMETVVMEETAETVIGMEETTEAEEATEKESSEATEAATEVVAGDGAEESPETAEDEATEETADPDEATSESEEATSIPETEEKDETETTGTSKDGAPPMIYVTKTSAVPVTALMLGSSGYYTAYSAALATYSINDATWDWENKTWTFRNYAMADSQVFCAQFGVDYSGEEGAYWLNSTDTSAAAMNITKLKFFVDNYGEILYGLDFTQRTWIIQRYVWESGYNMPSGSNTWRLNYDSGYTDSIYDELVMYAERGYDTGSIGIYVAGTGIQDFAMIGYSQGSLKLAKSGKTGGYSMAGALYDIYLSDDSTWTGISLITDADGKAYVAKKASSAPDSGLYTKDSSGRYWVSTGVSKAALIPGTYYVREYKVPDSGVYLLNGEHKKITITAGSTADMTSAEKAKTATLTVTKTTAATGKCKSQLVGNAMYSQDFSGTGFSVKVYSQVTGKWGSATTYTTGSGGTFTISGLIAGDKVEVTETKAPAGYLLPDTATQSITLETGSNSLTFKDKPTFDPGTPTINKLKYVNGQIVPGISLEGAVFRAEYYDNTSCSGTPVRTWYFRTDEDGMIVLADEYLAPGYKSDALYVDTLGIPELPLGSVKYTEVESPVGFKLYEGSVCGKVTQNAKTGLAEFEWISGSSGQVLVEPDGSVAVADEELVIAVDKVDNATGRHVAGAKLQVLEGKKVIHEWVTDGATHEVKEVLEPGKTYRIHEAQAPEGYQQAEDITFKTDNLGNITVTTAGAETYVNDSGFLTVKMKDVKKIVLPLTGSSEGPMMFISGMVLLTGGLTGGACAFKKRKEAEGWAC